MTPRQPVRYRECEECGSAFRIKNTLARFCSKRCQSTNWVRRHPGYMSEAQRRYLAADPERVARKRRRLREYNQLPHVIARRSELGKAAYPRRAEVLKARVRARREGYVIGHTHEEWLAKLAEYEHRCAYCGRADRKLTKDHVVPLSAGDPVTVDLIGNVVPACKSCNSAKNARVLDSGQLVSFGRWRMALVAAEASRLVLSPSTRQDGIALLCDVFSLEFVT